MIRRKLEFFSKSRNRSWGVKPNTLFQSSSNGVIRELSLIKVPSNAQISASQGREMSGVLQMIANLPSGAIKNPMNLFKSGLISEPMETLRGNHHIYTSIR